MQLRPPISEISTMGCGRALLHDRSSGRTHAEQRSRRFVLPPKYDCRRGQRLRIIELGNSPQHGLAAAGIHKSVATLASALSPGCGAVIPGKSPTNLTIKIGSGMSGIAFAPPSVALMYFASSLPVTFNKDTLTTDLGQDHRRHVSMLTERLSRPLRYQQWPPAAAPALPNPSRTVRWSWCHLTSRATTARKAAVLLGRRSHQLAAQAESLLRQARRRPQRTAWRRRELETRATECDMTGSLELRQVAKRMLGRPAERPSRDLLAAHFA